MSTDCLRSFIIDRERLSAFSTLHSQSWEIISQNEASVPYANAILERWFSEGIKTLEDIEKAEEKRVEENQSEPKDGSFDTDDFFEAALKRSYSKK